MIEYDSLAADKAFSATIIVLGAFAVFGFILLIVRSFFISILVMAIPSIIYLCFYYYYKRH